MNHPSMTTTRRLARLALACMAALLAAGCVAPGAVRFQATPRYDSQFGEAVRAARLAQTINPNAGRNTDPVSGIDAQSADSAIDRYHESFRAPPPPPSTIVIGAPGLAR